MERTYVACYSAGNNPELENAEINSLRGIHTAKSYIVRHYTKQRFPG